MNDIARPLVSYHVVPGDQHSVFSPVYHEHPHQDDTSLDHDGEDFIDHQHTHQAPQKPIHHSDASTSPKGTCVKIDSEGADPAEQKSQTWFSIWWLEIVCCIMFCGAFLAIIATIWSYQNRPLPDWPYHLTINALISIYVVIIKSALLFVTTQGLGQLKWRWFEREHPLKHLTNFDDATRGAWGSLTLLWMLKARHIIASCGAFITVATLLVGPFAQQVISSYQCTLPIRNIQASLPRTNFFFETGLHTGAAEDTLPIEVQKAINAGIFNPGTPVAFYCPTGNCTFPEVYHSVGYCHSCEDITADLIVTYHGDIPASYEDNTYTYTYTNVSLPMFLSVNSGWTQDTALLNDSFEVTTSNTAYLLMDYTNHAVVVSQLNESTSCSSDQPLYWGCDPSVPRSQYFGGLGVGAASCVIMPCVKSYQASITAGSVSEEIISTSNVWDYRSVLMTTINMACLPKETLGQLSSMNSTLERNGWLSTPYLMNDADSALPGPTPRYWIPSIESPSAKISIPVECVYLYDPVYTDPGIQGFLETYLSGTVGIATGSSYAYDYAGPAQLLAIYNNGNMSFQDLNRTFANISESLTQYIRQNGLQNYSSPAYGAVLQEQACVRVRWAWLAYPAVLIVLTLIFLPAVIAETRKGETKSHDWKSAPLALMFHGLDDEVVRGTEAGRLVKLKDMQDRAARVYVRLGRNKHGWVFIGGRTWNAAQWAKVHDTGEADHAMAEDIEMR